MLMTANTIRLSSDETATYRELVGGMPPTKRESYEASVRCASMAWADEAARKRAELLATDDAAEKSVLNHERACARLLSAITADQLLPKA